MTPRPGGPVRRAARLAPVLVVVALAATACGEDGGETASATTPVPATTALAGDAGSATTSSGDGGEEVSTAGITPAPRCELNRQAGTITYLSSFDFAAAASILDVVVAEENGYFDTMCLEVDLKPSFSTANYPLVASGQAQMSSAGSFTELVNFSTGGAELVAVADYGKTPIEALVVKPEVGAATLADLRGTTIGVKGDMPPSIVAMLNQAGLQRGQDYAEVPVDGFDPRAHLAQAIDALPVYKSNEPGQLDAAGIAYELFDPVDTGVPGSFGVLYTSAGFLADHPTAVQDFVRASFRGYADAVADPAGAVAIAVEQIEVAGNQSFLTAEGETFRWQQEFRVVQDGTPAGEPVGLVDPALLQAEVDAYAAAGVFETAPSIDGRYDAAVAAGVFDASGTLIWPA